MALILAFRASEAAPPGAPATTATRSAELIFFPGVRYERHAPDREPEQAQKARTARRGRPRELIDMMD